MSFRSDHWASSILRAARVTMKPSATTTTGVMTLTTSLATSSELQAVATEPVSPRAGPFVKAREYVRARLRLPPHATEETPMLMEYWMYMAIVARLRREHEDGRRP